MLPPDFLFSHYGRVLQFFSAVAHYMFSFVSSIGKTIVFCIDGAVFGSDPGKTGAPEGQIRLKSGLRLVHSLAD